MGPCRSATGVVPLVFIQCADRPKWGSVPPQRWCPVRPVVTHWPGPMGARHDPMCSPAGYTLFGLLAVREEKSLIKDLKRHCPSAVRVTVTGCMLRALKTA
jgi:hypothetical protein